MFTNALLHNYDKLLVRSVHPSHPSQLNDTVFFFFRHVFLRHHADGDAGSLHGRHRYEHLREAQLPSAVSSLGRQVRVVHLPAMLRSGQVKAISAGRQARVQRGLYERDRDGSVQ